MGTEAKPRRVREVRRIKVNGRWRWQARIAVGERRLSRLCDSEDEAKAAKAELRLQLNQEAEHETEESAAPATLALLCDAYLLDLEARGKPEDTIGTARNTVGRLKDVFGPRMQEPLRLTEADLYAFRAARLRQWAKRGKKAKDGTTPTLAGGAKASTINRDLRTIRAMLKRALPEFKFPKGIFFQEDETRVRWLEPLQEVDVMSRLASPFREMAQLAGLTMMRLSEIRRLRREQVALSQGVILLPKTKTGPGTVILSTEAQRILREQLDGHTSEWVFPNPETGSPYSRHYVGKMWRVKARKAGLSDFHFHDLRHHGATMALNAGFSAPIVMSLGRWKTERMMRRYAAVTDKTLRAAAEAVSGNLRPGSGNGQWQQAPKPALLRVTQ